MIFGIILEDSVCLIGTSLAKEYRTPEVGTFYGAG